LAADEVVREKVYNGVRYYEYYSKSAFKVKVSIVYGSIAMEVTDLKKNIFFSDVLTVDHEVSINASNTTEYLVGF
jgi:hypothetical protein